MGDLDVRVLITAFADGLRKTLKAAGDDAQNFTNRLSSGIGAASGQLRRIGGTLSKTVTAPLAAAGGAAVAFTKKFADAGAAILRTADKVGVGFRELQQLRFVGEQAGVDANTVDMALQRFSRRLAEAAQGGGELVGVLEQYGIQATDSEGKTRSVSAVFADLADAVAGTDDASEQLRIAFKAFDSEGAVLVNALRGGSEEVEALRQRFDDLGLGMSTEFGQTSEQFAQQWNIVTKQLEAAGLAIAQKLLPVVVNDLMPALIDNVIPGLIKAAEAVGDLIQWFADLPAPVQKAAGLVAAAIGVGGPILVALGAMGTAFAGIIAATGPIGLFIAALVGIGAVAWTFRNEIAAAVNSVLEFLKTTLLTFNEWWNEFWGAFFELFRSTFAAGFQFITDTTTAVTQGVVNAWQWVSDTLVGNSIIPDMWIAIQEWFQAGGDALARSSAATAKVTSKNFAGMASKSIGWLGELADAFAGHSQEMFIVSKATAIAQSLISTYQGIAKALELGWPMGPIAAAKIAAIGFAQVASIVATTIGGGGGGGGRGRGGGAAGISGGSAGAIAGAGAQPAPAPAPAAEEPERPLVVQVNIESRRNLFTREDIDQLFEQMNEAIGDNAILNLR